MHAHLRLRAIAGIGALTVVVFAMGGADVVARTAVAFAEGDGWSVDTKNAAGADVRRLTVTSDVDTARVKVQNANIELAQQASLPTNSAAGALAYDTTDGKFKVFDGALWVIPAVAPTRTVVTKPVDESVTYLSVPQDDDHLRFAIGANETWIADFWLQMAALTSIPDVKFTIQAPTGASVRFWGFLSIHNQGPKSSIDIKMATSAGQELFSSLYGRQDPPSNFPPEGLRIHVAVTTAASSGEVVLWWAQNTSNSSYTAVKAGSRLIATKIQ